VKRTVAMTGATGFIGWHVAHRFQNQGWHVRALVRPGSNRPLPQGVERVTAPLVGDDVRRSCDGASVILHLAAVIKTRAPEEFTRSNIEGTREVALAARALGIRLVHTSSLGVTGPGDPADPPREDDPPNPINQYGESKRESERIVREMDGLDWTIVRPTLVYGPRDRLLYPVFRLARLGIFPSVRPSAAYNFVHVEDVARGFERAAESGAASKEIFFLGHPAHVTGRDLLREIAGIVGRRFRPLVIPRTAGRLAAEVGTLAARVGIRLPLDRARWRELDAPGFVCRVDKATTRLGFTAAIDLADGLRTTADWYRREGWLR
jgi:nucleoside-diphosphate-sugar epimerase